MGSVVILLHLLLSVVMRLPAAEAEDGNLTGTVGGSITLPGSVPEFGFLLRGKNIAMVNNKELKILDAVYKDRVLWNKDTGLFTLTDLRINDSGIYVIDSKEGKTFAATLKLTVYDSVPTPAVKTLSVSSDRCSLLCSVDKQTTLLWYRDEEILNQNSSADSLQLTLHRQYFNSSYRCVAASPAENKTLSVDVRTLCSGQIPPTSGSPIQRKYMITIVAPIVGVAVILFAAFMIKKKYLDQKKTTQITQTQESEGEVQYTDVHICNKRYSQGKNLPDSSETVDRSNLTTLYDQLEAHRIIPPDSTVHG